MNKNFKILNEFKGFGEPSGKIWFIGIEEAGVWSKDPNECKKEIEGYRNSRGFRYNDGNDSLNSPVYVTISKIMSELNGNGMDWSAYRKLNLFREGSDVFQMNLFPLGKKRVVDWPGHYKAVFGYGKEDYKRYISNVKTTRFQMLEDFWNKKSPEVTICFGKTYWSEFQKLLNLNGHHETYEDGFIILYREERVVLTPFFGHGHMSDGRIQTLVKILKDTLV